MANMDADLVPKRMEHSCFLSSFEADFVFVCDFHYPSRHQIDQNRTFWLDQNRTFKVLRRLSQCFHLWSPGWCIFSHLCRPAKDRRGVRWFFFLADAVSIGIKKSLYFKTSCSKQKMLTSYSIHPTIFQIIWPKSFQNIRNHTELGGSGGTRTSAARLSPWGKAKTQDDLWWNRLAKGTGCWVVLNKSKKHKQHRNFFCCKSYVFILVTCITVLKNYVSSHSPKGLWKPCGPRLAEGQTNSTPQVDFWWLFWWFLINESFFSFNSRMMMIHDISMFHGWVASTLYFWKTFRFPASWPWQTQGSMLSEQWKGIPMFQVGQSLSKSSFNRFGNLFTTLAKLNGWFIRPLLHQRVERQHSQPYLKNHLHFRAFPLFFLPLCQHWACTFAQK